MDSISITKGEVMHNIYDCVDSFTSLLDTQYYLILGRKNLSVTLQIAFDKKDCFHLMGLQYLTDRPELSRDRGKIFDEIKERKLTVLHIESSAFYYKIAERVNMLTNLEEIFDCNETIYKFNSKNNYSMIQAEYLMKHKIEEKNVFLFLAKNQKKNIYFCRSFFPEEIRDYTKNQASWKLLYKKKVNMITNQEIILCDKLKQNPS